MFIKEYFIEIKNTSVLIEQFSLLKKGLWVMFKKLAFLSPTLLLMAMSVDAKAAVASASNVSSSWGRAQFSAAGSSGDLGIFGGDVMLPLYNNSNGFVYGDAMGDYSTDATYLMSPGVGYRGVVNNQIFGAYAFTDYEKTSLGEYFWVLSPGVEWISPQWDAHVNLYFPTSKRQEDGGVVFADTLENYEYVDLPPNTHDQYDMQQQPYAVIGNGVDAEIGYSFAGKDNLKSRVYLGSYYYQPPGDTLNILGETLGYQQALTKNLSFSLSNSYDEVNHYAMNVGLTLTFGGNSNEYSTNVQDRLLDPVERHIGIIDTGAGTYDQQTTENRGMALQYDNIYSMSPNGSGTQDGTNGNPMTLSQTNLNTINEESPDGARIYLQGGSNVVYDIGVGSVDDGAGLVAYNGQDFYGRTPDYKAPASYDERPLINVEDEYEGFILNGGENTFSDLYIYASGSSDDNTSGIDATNGGAGNEVLTINNTTITGFASGVYALNSGTGNFTINATNSQFNDNGVDEIGGLGAYGMEVSNSGSGNMVINTTESQFNNNSSDLESAAGLYMTNSGSGELTLNATSSQFSNNSTTATSANAYGVYAGNSGAGKLTINADQSNFDSNTAGVNSWEAYGLYVSNDAGSGDAFVNATSSSFNSNTATGSGNFAYGMFATNQASGNLTITANTSEFDNNSATNAGYAAGLSVNNNGAGEIQVNANNTEFNSNLGGTSAGGYGMQANNSATGTVIISAINSEFNNNSLDGMVIDNTSTDSGSLQVTNLSGSTFNDNGVYGIYNYNGTVNELDSPNVIDTTGATFYEPGVDQFDYNW